MDLSNIKITPLLDTLRLQKISDEVYFSEKYRGYVSNSRLGLINPDQGGSAEKFFNGFQFSFSTSFQLGSAVHELVLQPESFELAEDVGKPTAKLGAMADELYPVWLQHPLEKEDIIKASDKVGYYKGKITDELVNKVLISCYPYWNKRKALPESDKELIFLDSKSLEITKSCVEALRNNKSVQNLLHPEGLIDTPISENEQAILLDVEVNCPDVEPFIIRLKSKLDNYTIDLDTITVNDVKTLGKMLNEMDTNIVNYHYSREFGMYVYLLKLCAEKFYNIKDPRIKANYLIVSTIPNFYTKVRPVTTKEIAQGFNEFKSLLKLVAYYIAYKGYTLE
jgi:hypothetical protein